MIGYRTRIEDLEDSVTYAARLDNGRLWANIAVFAILTFRSAIKHWSSNK